MDICPAFDDMWPRGHSSLLHTYDIIETGPKETQIYAVFSGELISLCNQLCLPRAPSTVAMKKHV